VRQPGTLASAALRKPPLQKKCDSGPDEQQRPYQVTVQVSDTQIGKQKKDASD
jgi:hypothetical protein